MRIVIIAFSAITLLSVKQQPDGKKLFTEQCAPCHGIDKRYTAMPFQRIRNYYSEEQLLTFIHHPVKFILADKRMQVTRGLNYCGIMPAYPHMKPAELKAILDYVDRFPYDSTSPLYAHRKFSSAQQDSVIKICEEVSRKLRDAKSEN